MIKCKFNGKLKNWEIFIDIGIGLDSGILADARKTRSGNDLDVQQNHKFVMYKNKFKEIMLEYDYLENVISFVTSFEARSLRNVYLKSDARRTFLHRNRFTLFRKCEICAEQVL